MIYIQIIYMIASAIAIAACIPQIRQLLISKRSDELSLQTWATWTFTQMATLLYVASIGNVLLICVNAIWVSFYAVMALLIIRFRRAPKSSDSVLAAAVR